MAGQNSSYAKLVVNSVLKDIHKQGFAIIEPTEANTVAAQEANRLADALEAVFDRLDVEVIVNVQTDLSIRIERKESESNTAT